MRFRLTAPSLPFLFDEEENLVIHSSEHVENLLNRGDEMPEMKKKEK